MTWLAVAVGGSAALGAGGSIWSGMIQRDAAKDAAALQSDASFRGQQTLRDSQALALSLLAPFLGRGNAAGDTLSRLLVSPKERQRQSALERTRLQSDVERLSVAGDWNAFPILTGKNASERRASLFTEQEANRKNQLGAAQAKLSEFDKLAAVDAAAGTDGEIEASTLYEWQRDVGTKYLDRSLAKKGLSKSGEGMKVLGDFVRGLGAEESERQVGRLMGMHTMGANAANNTANVLGAFGPQMAGMQVQQGQAEAQGILGAGQATSNMITGVANAITSGVGGFMQYDTFQSLMNRNNNRSAPDMNFDPSRLGQ